VRKPRGFRADSAGDEGLPLSCLGWTARETYCTHPESDPPSLRALQVLATLQKISTCHVNDSTSRYSVGHTLLVLLAIQERGAGTSTVDSLGHASPNVHQRAHEPR